MSQWGNDYREGMREAGREAWWTTKKGILYIVLPLFGLGCVCSVWGYVKYFVKQPVEVVKKTLKADNVIYKYEWFKDKAAALDAAEKAIQITKGKIEAYKRLHGNVPFHKWDWQSKQHMNSLMTDLQGQEIHFKQLKEEYRAACKKANWVIFKDEPRIMKWVRKLKGKV